MDIQYISKWLQTSEVNDENRHDSSLNIQTNFASILNKSAMFVPTNRDKNYFYCTTIPAGDRCSKIVTVYQYLSCLPVPYFDVCVCVTVCVSCSSFMSGLSLLLFLTTRSMHVMMMMIRMMMRLQMYQQWKRRPMNFAIKNSIVLLLITTKRFVEFLLVVYDKLSQNVRLQQEASSSGIPR